MASSPDCERPLIDVLLDAAQYGGAPLIAQHEHAGDFCKFLIFTVEGPVEV